MMDTIIVGSGFSALVSYLLIKKQNPQVLAFSKINSLNKFLIKRKNLITNKFYSEKSSSYGNLNFIFKQNLKLHDRLNMGGNSNIWGGFIDTANLSKHFTEICKENLININRLEYTYNGYKSNISSLRQLRDYRNNILDTSLYFNNFINGYLYSFEIQKNIILLKYLNGRDQKFKIIKTKKLILAISFPQIIDLLFRSGFLNNNILQLSDFSHKFEISFNKNLKMGNKNDCIIKYDFLRSLKHYFGYQKSLDKYNIPLPLYVKQTFANHPIIINLKLNSNLKCVESLNNLINFGSSIHYCNLLIDNINANNFLNNISKNIIGVGMPFLKQKKPGPISGDIVNDITHKLI